VAPPRRAVPVDAYVLDVLLRDLVGHDKRPAAFLVYLHLYGRAARSGWRGVPGSLREIADETGLSKSAVQAAMRTLRRRQLITSHAMHRTAVPLHDVKRHWTAAARHKGAGGEACRRHALSRGQSLDPLVRTTTMTTTKRTTMRPPMGAP
jgi:hypothetical protein